LFSTEQESVKKHGSLWGFLHYYLPTIISSTSDEFFLILLQMSIVKMVLLLLKIEVKEEIKADIITANIKPGRNATCVNNRNKD